MDCYKTIIFLYFYKNFFAMKRINYLFLSLLFYTITFSAQDYDPVIKDGSFWDVSADHNGCAFVKRIIISNDTLINNKVYKKLLLLQ